MRKLWLIGWGAVGQAEGSEAVIDEEAGSVMGGTRKTMTRQDHEAALEAGRVTYAESGDWAEETDDDGCGGCG